MKFTPKAHYDRQIRAMQHGVRWQKAFYCSAALNVILLVCLITYIIRGA